MVFRQQRLQYDPPLEELRSRHYRDLLNAFLGLPLKMKGVSDLSERPGFFRAIAECSPQGVVRLYTSAEALFAKLQEELKAYQVAAAAQPVLVDNKLTAVAELPGRVQVGRSACLADGAPKPLYTPHSYADGCAMIPRAKAAIGRSQ
jgi:hypothetical protein